jgi:hypothetical protein
MKRLNLQGITLARLTRALECDPDLKELSLDPECAYCCVYHSVEIRNLCGVPANAFLTILQSELRDAQYRLDSGPPRELRVATHQSEQGWYSPVWADRMEGGLKMWREEANCALAERYVVGVDLG